jgi:hypothetical protein
MWLPVLIHAADCTGAVTATHEQGYRAADSDRDPRNGQYKHARTHVHVNTADSNFNAASADPHEHSEADRDTKTNQHAEAH